MAPHNDNEDDDQPVSFQELKKRWAQHEANSSSPQQQQHHQQQQQPQQPQQQQEPSPPPVIPDTSSPTPTPTPPPPQSNAVNSKPIPPRSPIQRVANVSGTMHKASSAPPIPPKPAAATIRMPTPMKAPTDPSVVVDMSINKQQQQQQQKEPKSSVSVLAKQLEGQHITKSPSLSSSSSAAVADISESPSPLQQDPFCDEEEASDDDDSSSCTSTATSNSEDSEVDDELVRKVQMRYSGVSPAIRTPPPPPKDAITTTTAKKSGSSNTPPPPPPPSKKYHSVARSIDIPKTTSPVDASPPSLPPRPCALGKSYSEMDQQHSNTMPVLPPRPSPSVIARSHTTSNHRSTTTSTASTPQRSASARKAFKNFSHATGVYPDLSEASRKKPFINGRDRRIPTGHRGTIRAIAIQGACLATGAHETRIWNTDTSQCLYSIDANPGETNDKVSALAFAPPRHPRDEGTRLWIGHRDGELLVVDTLSGRTIEKMQQQQQAITAMLRYRNTELWTIDESGLLCIWDAYDMHIKEQRMVMPRSVTALLRDRDLWMASGRTLQMFPEHGSSTHRGDQEEEKRIRIPNDLGNITQMATMSHHPGKVFVAHDNGKVSIWDAFTLEKRETMMVSMYGITAMVAVGEYYLWMGYNTGMIYVYDTRPERWVVIKAWRAHHSAIVSLQVEDIGIALGDETVQVVSADSHGYVALWDGLLPEHWKDHQMAQYKHDYCTERDMNLLICSWNIDANKPEKLSVSDDQRIREWLASMEDPDIIVVGIQEIVDLESKKQTARSLFASRKKVDTLQEANELLTHRYSLWHDYLVQLIYETHPYSEYTVIKTDQLVGLFSCIFVKTSELRHVSLVESTVVKTGLKVMHKSLHGNKGGIAIRFRVQDSTLCFVNCHLAAGQSHTQQRNSDAEGILQTAEFHAFENNDAGIFANGGDGSMILDHEHCFLSGDLNYRINMSRERVLQLLAGYDPEQSFDALQREDQLLKQRMTNPLFKLLLFSEPRIDFLPTYKYDPGTDYYDRSEKKRVPAWCDRILYRSRDAHNLFYQRHEVLASDHRPISSGFVIRIKQVDRSKQRQVAFHVDEAWHHHYSRLVQAAKIAYIVDFGFMDHDTASKQLEAAQWDVARVMDQAAM